jgi:hypothetical protein
MNNNTNIQPATSKNTSKSGITFSRETKNGLKSFKAKKFGLETASDLMKQATAGVEGAINMAKAISTKCVAISSFINNRTSDEARDELTDWYNRLQFKGDIRFNEKAQCWQAYKKASLRPSVQENAEMADKLWASFQPTR